LRKPNDVGKLPLGLVRHQTEKLQD
jgi:hypothetical protein